MLDIRSNVNWRFLLYFVGQERGFCQINKSRGGRGVGNEDVWKHSFWTGHPDFASVERVKGFEPSTSCLGSKHSTAELHPPAETSKAKFQVTGYSESSQKFTSQLLDDFITSRTSGTTQKTITLYHFALDRFIGYPLTPEGINGYLKSLTCGNAKHNYFRCILKLLNLNVTVSKLKQRTIPHIKGFTRPPWPEVGIANHIRRAGFTAFSNIPYLDIEFSAYPPVVI